jgi:hypothetical protein
METPPIIWNHPVLLIMMVMDDLRLTLNNWLLHLQQTTYE